MKRRILIALLCVLAGLALLWLRPVPELSKQGLAMNTIISMRVFSHNDKILDQAYALLNRLDSLLSMYNPGSQISRINSLAGLEKLYAEPEVLEVVNDSRRLYELTEGIFNPLIGPVTRLWKINSRENTRPSPESLDAAIRLSDIENLEIESDSRIFLRHKGCILDLGGIAKGYASSKIADMLRDNGVKSGILDLGGNIYAIGDHDGTPWRIGIRDPMNPQGSPALVVHVENSSVITSGNYERFRIVDGRKYSHFFDVKTGESVQSDLLSVTLVTPDGSLGDGLATAFMIAGYEKSARILGKLTPQPGVIFIRQTHSGKPEIITNMKGAIIGARYSLAAIE